MAVSNSKLKGLNKRGFQTLNERHKYEVGIKGRSEQCYAQRALLIRSCNWLIANMVLLTQGVHQKWEIICSYVAWNRYWNNLIFLSVGKLSK